MKANIMAMSAKERGTRPCVYCGKPTTRREGALSYSICRKCTK